MWTCDVCGARLWQRREAAVNHQTFGHFALIAIAVNAMQICEAEQ